MKRVADQERKISIVIPVYNAEKYLGEALESVLAQTYENWEVILVVSMSEDKTEKVVEEYLGKDPRFSRLDNEGRGISSARNKGLSAADGEYLLFMDADDYLPDSRVFQRYLNIAEKISADIIVSNYARLWKGRFLPAETHQSFSVYHRDSEEFRFRGFFSVGTLSYVWGKLYRRSFLMKNGLRFEDFPYAEDKLFNMQCYVRRARYAFIEEIGYVYRRNEASVSYKYNPHSSDCWLGIARQLKWWLEEKGEDEAVYGGLVEYTVFFASFFDAKKEYEQHRHSLWAIRKNLRIYGRDAIGGECFRKLLRGKRVAGLEQKFWKVLIRGYSLGMRLQFYSLLAIGTRELINHKVDERMSDTGLREE